MPHSLFLPPRAAQAAPFPCCHPTAGYGQARTRLRGAVAGLLLALGPGLAAATAPVQPQGQASACGQLLQRLPGVTAAQCQAAQLVASGQHSRLGRPLYWRDVLPATPPGAEPPLRVLVLGAMHGDELSSASLAMRWIAQAEKSARPVHWRFIPVLNPDGLLAKRPTRVNAKGVDLNRNFRTPQWEQEAPRWWKQRTRKDPRRWPGPAPLSEPESRFVHAQMDQFRPHLVVSIHAPYGVLDFDGPHEPPQRLGRLRLDRVGVFPGSLGHYGGLQQGMPVVTIELTHALHLPPEAEQRSMWQDLLQWMDAKLDPQEPPRAAQARK